MGPTETGRTRASPLRPPSSYHRAAVTTDDFLALFGLTASDLEENRRGRLSATQARLARAATREDAIWMGGFAIGAWVVMGGVLWIFQTSPHAFRWGSALSPSELGILALILALPVAATIWAVWTLVVHVRSRAAARVEVREGIVRRSVLRHRQAAVHTIAIDGESLDVSPRAFECIDDGARYRVYYVARSRVVVMIEPA